MIDFKTYYKAHFQRDLLSFVGQIPIEGNKHYDRNEFSIQYFFLTPQYRYLDIIPQDRRGLFAVALFWTVLTDQTMYTYFRNLYQSFRRNALYPKFIGNCTAPSLMSSQCGHHQHPSKILKAINDTLDKGNHVSFDRKTFEKDESQQIRPSIEYHLYLKEARQVMKEEIKDYFEKHQPKIDWIEFWNKCEKESLAI